MTTYDPERLLRTAEALNAGMPSEWADGDRGMLQYALRTAAASADLLEAAELLEKAETAHLSCDECEPEDAPETCEKCFPLYDEARVKRRLAIAAVRPRPREVAGKS